MLTVQDVINRTLFSKTEVVAGVQGLNRQVKWTHVLDNPYFDDTLLQGGELILSTGFGFDTKDSSNISFLQNLIEHNASCLCIELGHYFEKVPTEMIKLANEYNFPIITFNEFINFVEITQDLHTFIINNHHEKLIKLDSISRKFFTFSLTTQGLTNILKLLHQSTGAQIIYHPFSGAPFAVPRLNNEYQNQLLQNIEIYKLQNYDQVNNTSFELKTLNQTILLNPIGAMDQIWAELMLVLDRESDEFDFLILDRASLAISQKLMRKHFLDEKKLLLESTWLNDLLNKRVNNEDNARGFIPIKSKHGALRYRIAIIDVQDVLHTFTRNSLDEEYDSIIYNNSLRIRSEFEKNSFSPYITSIRNQFIVLAIDLGLLETEKERFSKVVNALLIVTIGKSSKIQIGVGRQYQLLIDAHEGYKEAQLAINYRNLSSSSFYEDLGIFRLLLLSQRNPELTHFIEDYLSLLIEYDKNYGTEFLFTLTKYFEFDRSVKLTAQNLHIVRQTLYHRLNKIKKIINLDFDLIEHRLNIEIALKAYQLIKQNEYQKTK